MSTVAKYLPVIDCATVYEVKKFRMSDGGGVSFAVPHYFRFDYSGLEPGSFRLVFVNDGHRGKKWVPDIIPQLCVFSRKSLQHTVTEYDAKGLVRWGGPAAPFPAWTLEHDKMLVVDRDPDPVPATYTFITSIPEQTTALEHPPAYLYSQYWACAVNSSAFIAQHSQVYAPLDVIGALDVVSLLEIQDNSCFLECVELESQEFCVIRVDVALVDVVSFTIMGRALAGASAFLTLGRQLVTGCVWGDE
ncbi:hypothetical protein DFH09DRAFT_1113089 [Mycena vulgaris]|nr:hypothetical protein DFH09DRAFT_1113089 [Mycena vulgaris]